MPAMILLLGGLSTSGGTAPNPSQSSTICLAATAAALAAGRFTGPLVCSRKHATFVLAGRTRGAQFTIFDYRYRYLPDGGNVMHGGQKIVVFRRDKYVGQYALSPPPYAGVTVKGAQVRIRIGESPKITTLDFSRAPPQQALLDGYVVVFHP
ncbi:hypothetical protein QE385_003256 [Sphingomonas sp. SORGH_AS 950]|uniref:hypothetical protein n=1 Tax=Sphingomonas sp. SORGH_AS_0950 TaxID=3041792 RepID=UPI00278B55F8|nr:hypothetical protein [Sphingomonas sp. SORGH_AS_0950]MDQ1158929.1 hypothetical protein [Sphingomonas sp. SORGH_AS_0950]